MKKLLLLLLGMQLTISVYSQQYTGMSGLIHVPSAEMDNEGVARIGSHYLNKFFLPDEAFDYNGKYHSEDFYLSITPFAWIEIGYTITLRKGNRANWDSEDIGYHRKDQYFSLKVRPIVEKAGKWWPSIAIGTNDPKTNGDRGENTGQEKNRNLHFGNYYIATSKHLNLNRNLIGFHLTYRHWVRTYNSKWNGLVGGITFQPHFQNSLRFIAEYTGDDVNVGFDWKIWKCLLLQSSLQNGKYFTGGLCFCIDLL